MEQFSSENTPIELSGEEILKMSQDSIESVFGGEKKKETTEASSSQLEETVSESTTQSTEEEQPPKKKKRGSVVSKKPSQGQPSESSVGKEDDVKIGGFTQELKERKKEQKQDLTGKRELVTKAIDRPKLKAVTEAEKQMRNITFDETGKVKVKEYDPLPEKRLDIQSNYTSFDDIIALDQILQKKKDGKAITIELPSGYTPFFAGDKYKKEFNEKIGLLKNSALEIVKDDLIFTDKDEAFLEQEYNSELNRTGFFNKAQDFITEASRAAEAVGAAPMGTSIFLKDNDLSKIYAELEKQDKSFKSKTAIEQEQLVKEKFIEDRKTSLMMSKFNAAAEKLTPQQRAAMSIYSTRLLNATNNEISKETKNITSIKSTAEALMKKRDELVSLSQKLVADNKSPDEKMVNEFNSIQSQLKKLEVDFDKERTKIYNNSKKVTDLKIAVKAYNSETNEVADFLKRLKASALGIASNIGYLNIQFLKQVLPEKTSVKGALSSEIITAPMKAGVEILEKEEEKVRSRIRETKEINNVNDFVDYSLGFLGDNTLITLAMVATGGASAVPTTLIAADTAGHTFRQLNKENKEFGIALKEAEKNNKKTFDFNGETYNVEKNKGKELYSTGQITTTGILHGSLMTLPALKQLAFLKSQKQIIQAIESRSPDFIANSISSNIIKKAGKFSKEVGELDIILRATGLGQAVTNDLVLNKKENYLEAFGKLDHTYTSFLLHSLTAGMGYAFVNKTVTPYIKNKDAKTMDLNTKIGMDALEKISDPNISAEDKAIYQKRLEEANAENQKIIETTIDNIGALPKQEFDKTQKLIKDSSDIRIQAEEIKKSGVSEEVKAEELSKLKKKYIETQKEIISIQESAAKRTDGFFGEDAKTQQEYIDNAKKELEAENKDGKEITERDIKYRALINYRDVKNPIEKNVYYYRGDVEPELPEGYTNVKKVENSVELDMYYRQQAKLFKTAEEIRAIPEADRTDAQKKSLVIQDFEAACSEKGVSQVEIDAAVSIMEARAKASGIGDKWFDGIEVSELKPEAKPEVEVEQQQKPVAKTEVVTVEVKPTEVVKEPTTETVETKPKVDTNEAIEDGKRLINALNITDFKSMVGEISNLLKNELTPDEQKIFNDWAGTETWTEATSEAFSEGFEQYIMTGKAPTSRLSSLYEKASVFLKSAYENIRNKPTQFEITEEAIQQYDKMFLTEGEVQVNKEKEVSLQRLNLTSLNAISLDIFQELKKSGLIKEIPC